MNFFEKNTHFLYCFNKNVNFTKYSHVNYFFLANNVNKLSTFTQYHTFAKIPTPLVSEIHSTPSLLIKKNLLFYLKNIGKFRNYYTFKKYLFILNFKQYSHFFNFISTLRTNSPSKLKNNHFPLKQLKVVFFKQYLYYYKKNWSFLIGGLISPFMYEVQTKRKLDKKLLNLKYIKNNFIRRNKKRLIKKKFSYFKNKFFLKKIFINNFFYFNKIKLSYKNFNFSIRNLTKPLFKRSNDWLLSRPYLFLNTYTNVRFLKNYSNSSLLPLYKYYIKIFVFCKRHVFRLRNSNDFFFKYNYFNSLHSDWKKISHFLITPGQTFAYKIGLFVLKRKNPHNTFFLTKAKKKYKKKRSIKLRNRLFWNLKNSPRVPFYRKHKSFFSLIGAMSNSTSKSSKLSKVAQSTNFKLLRKMAIFLTFKTNLHFKVKKKRYAIKKFFTSTCNNKSILNNFKKPLTFFNLFVTPRQRKSTFFYKHNFFKLNLPKNTLKIRKKFKLSYRFKLLKKPTYLSKSRTSFKLNKYGFFFLTDSFKHYLNKKNKFSYNLKKLIYSFSYKNEIHRYVLKRYSKNFSIFFNKKNKQPSFTTKYLLSKNYTLTVNENNNMLLKKNEIFSLFNQNLSNSSNWTYFKSQLLFWKNSSKNDINVNIKRVKFKPGYMTMWRDARTVLKSSLNLKFRYQRSLTRYLMKYKKFINFRTFLISEMRLLNVLIKSRFFPDYNICELFLRNNLIFINGFIVSNSNFQLFVGDFIQIITTLKYYIMYRWFLNWSLKKKIRLKKVIRKKMHSSSDSDEKKRSKSLPNWILFSKNSFDDVAKYLEVDYFTLSSMILYEPFLWNELNPYSLHNIRFGVINLYNWKYIN